MKSAVLASVLLGSLALAAPLEKRRVHTVTLVETVVTYTTVYATESETAVPTSIQGLFFEKPGSEGAPGAPGSPGAPGQPGQPGSPGSAATSTAAPVAAPVNTPAPQAPAAPEQPKPTTTAQVQQQEQPAQQAPAAQPAPASSSPAPAAAPASSPASAPASNSPATSSGGSGEFSGDITIYDNNGGYGACGTVLHDSDMIVALAKDAWGSSTYDVMTGAATNPWCGQKINIYYQGKSVQATIMDMCPGCSGHDIDLSLSAWTALTGLAEKTRLTATWSKA